MIKRIKEAFLQRGAANVPIIIGLLLLGVALPAALKLVQQRQETRRKAVHCSKVGAEGSCFSLNCCSGEMENIGGTMCRCIEPTPTETPVPEINYRCGMSGVCVEDVNGNYETLADCENVCGCEPAGTACEVTDSTDLANCSDCCGGEHYCNGTSCYCGSGPTPTPDVDYRCGMSGVCVEDVNGNYETLADCEAECGLVTCPGQCKTTTNCGPGMERDSSGDDWCEAQGWGSNYCCVVVPTATPTPDVDYRCGMSGVCVEDPNGNYETMADCENVCGCEPAGTACEVTDSTDLANCSDCCGGEHYCNGTSCYCGSGPTPTPISCQWDGDPDAGVCRDSGCHADEESVGQSNCWAPGIQCCVPKEEPTPTPTSAGKDCGDFCTIQWNQCMEDLTCSLHDYFPYEVCWGDRCEAEPTSTPTIPSAMCYCSRDNCRGRCVPNYDSLDYPFPCNNEYECNRPTPTPQTYLCYCEGEDCTGWCDYYYSDKFSEECRDQSECESRTPACFCARDNCNGRCSDSYDRLDYPFPCGNETECNKPTPTPQTYLCYCTEADCSGSCDYFYSHPYIFACNDQEVCESISPTNTPEPTDTPVPGEPTDTPGPGEPTNTPGEGCKPCPDGTFAPKNTTSFGCDTDGKQITDYGQWAIQFYEIKHEGKAVSPEEMYGDYDCDGNVTVLDHGLWFANWCPTFHTNCE